MYSTEVPSKCAVSSTVVPKFNGGGTKEAQDAQNALERSLSAARPYSVLCTVQCASSLLPPHHSSNKKQHIYRCYL
jgi:hypothetical protein